MSRVQNLTTGRWQVQCDTCGRRMPMERMAAGTPEAAASAAASNRWRLSAAWAHPDVPAEATRGDRDTCARCVKAAREGGAA
jgi:hypothetical protein